MTNNDILRSLRYLLDISDARVVEIIGLADQEVSLQEVAAWLAREDEEATTPAATGAWPVFSTGWSTPCAARTRAARPSPSNCR